MLKHGGALIQASSTYGIPIDQWLDLSTGINPNGWPVPLVPASVWQRLPERDDGLLEVAHRYYKTEQLLPTAGSQAVIQLLPTLRQRCKIAIPNIGYAEHAYAWSRQGHEVIPLSVEQIFERAAEFDVILLINPNNPSGQLIARDRLLTLHEQIKAQSAWLVVDEAFMDADDKHSLVTVADKSGLFVLRSVGKFFGLAGIRAGFVIAEQQWLDKIEDRLGPWAVSGPSRWVCQQALADIDWQLQMRRELQTKSAKLRQLLQKTLNVPVNGTDLFQTCMLTEAEKIYQHLAEQGILVRLLDSHDGLRFGLPTDEAGFLCLEKALSSAL